jgi:hypothetical protein
VGGGTLRVCPSRGSVIHRREVRHPGGGTPLANRGPPRGDRNSPRGPSPPPASGGSCEGGSTERAVQLSRVGGTLRLQCSETLEVTDGWVAPRYGVKLPARVLLARRRDQLPFAITTDIVWEPV